jgi:DNA-binding beta-propeller fold protein YncE
VRVVTAQARQTKLNQKKNNLMNVLNPSRKPAARSCAGCWPALFLLAGMLATALPLRADNPPTYLFQWGSGGSGNGQFDGAFGIGVDSSNNIYVADEENFRVEKFDSNGNYLRQWSGPVAEQLGSPLGIAVDSSNNVYVADEDNSNVEKFDSNGNYLTQWGGPGNGNGQFNSPSESSGPFGIAVDSSNNVYVADNYNNRIEKFTSNGTYLMQWGSYGSGNGQFDGPEGIAVDSSNNIYVADNGNCRIEKFTSNGNYLTQWGSQGSGNGQLYLPEGIAVDRNNNVYVADQYNARIEKFSSNGNYLAQWGSQGSGNGQFELPQGIAVDSTGNFIYVTDVYDNLIQVFVNNLNIVAPIITNQPASQIVLAGVNVTFSVGVVGTAPFAYQWSSNSIAISSATNATFTLTNVSLSDSATYSVLVTNSYGSALSSDAVLAVLPVVVMTQPASSVTTTGAVLNGSVTVGPDETVAWFEWGTDTNYGNIEGETIIPGNNGSNNISSTLGGLPGNIYHYRIDAANDFGIVYGNDQSFTVGSAPTATTLAAVVSTNGATLNATVNPNGWDTTAYFKWGTLSYLLTNSTPVVDVGAGATPVSASSIITSLVPFTQYYYQVVASNYLGSVFAGEITVLSPGVPPGEWQSVAVSADGTKMVAGSIAASSFGVYVSANNGLTWAHQFKNRIGGVASSADGSILVAGPGASYDGPIITSTNSGVAWTSATNAPSFNWNAFAASADGSKLAAVAISFPGVYMSTNSGVNWTRQTNGLPPNSGFINITSSADGSKLVAAETGLGGAIFTSTNFGVNWTQATNAPLTHWLSVASSADGNTLMACAYSVGNVYLSTNAGVIWTKTGLPAQNWNSVAESADGTKMVALANSGIATFGIGRGAIFTSKDSGATWVTNNVPSAAWTCAAMSADGNEIISAVGNPSTTGGIYVFQTTPVPVLNLSAPDNVISWIIPSLDFTLQQSPDLLNWTDVTNQPVLDLTNLQNQVVLPPPDGNNFFRLMH